MFQISRVSRAHWRVTAGGSDTDQGQPYVVLATGATAEDAISRVQAGVDRLTVPVETGVDAVLSALVNLPSNDLPDVVAKAFDTLIQGGTPAWAETACRAVWWGLSDESRATISAWNARREGDQTDT